MTKGKRSLMEDELKITTTQDDILKSVANSHSYDTWGEAMNDTHEHTQIQFAKEAMDIWANILVSKRAFEDGMLMGTFSKKSGEEAIEYRQMLIGIANTFAKHDKFPKSTSRIKSLLAKYAKS